MKWQFITVGKPALAYARAGVDDYLGRIRRYRPVEALSVKAGDREEESARLLQASAGSYRIVLDERGRTLRTMEFAEIVTRLELVEREKCAAVLIGGADGHSNTMRENADLLLSFGAMTLQHELTLVVALEQVYRVCTIQKGEPYHRES